MAYLLARLACSRARLQQAISTARACGNWEYCRNNYPNFEMLDKRINALLKVLDPKVVEEAREITNAPI